MGRGTIRVLLPALLLIGATQQGCAQDYAGPQDSETGPFDVSVFVDGLDHPWSMAFLPNGDMLVTERPGRLRIVRGGVLLPDAVAGVPEVRARGQGGLMEVALHPDFASNNLIYLTFSKPRDDGDEGTTALVRGRFQGDRLTDVEELFEARAWSRGGAHFGSRIQFDGQGHLFLTVGDRGASPVPETVESHPAQDPSNHQGTVIRLDLDGGVPADNPFVGQDDALPEIWSYGHRNPQGLVYDPATGNLWDLEHGPQGGDELNLVLPGRNYGWPVIGYGVQYGGSVIHESTERDGMDQPAHYWVPSIATSGLLLYTGDLFPAWRGNIFAGGLEGSQIARLTMDGQRVVNEETLLSGIGRVRDIRQGPDGAIYVAIDDGDAPILRLTPAGN